jgi:16S rRNA (guanine966-N2)-methyltransferase
MRIIAGRFKGRRLAAPTWEGLRPTSDKLRETLFNVLAPRLAGARVLDLCAGTGAVGLEALSRGAAMVIAVDADARAVALARRNAEACGVTADYTIQTGDVLTALPRLDAAGPFDIIYLDPPYAFARTREVLQAAAAACCIPRAPGAGAGDARRARCARPCWCACVISVPETVR